MEEEMLEQTNEPVEETEKVEESTEIIADEPTKEKTFTQSQVDEMMKNREARVRKKVEREYKSSLSKYQELAYLTQQGLKADSLDDTLEKSREFYGKQGITYVPNNDDDEIVGKAYANEIISEADSLKELEDTAKRLSSKDNLSKRDKIILDNLNGEIESRKRVATLQSIGVTEEEYTSQDFKNFESKFSKETPIEEVYEIYKRNTDVKPVENPGSMKSIPGKEKVDYLTPEQVDKMTPDEMEKNMDLIRESMYRWK